MREEATPIEYGRTQFCIPYLFEFGAHPKYNYFRDKMRQKPKKNRINMEKCQVRTKLGCAPN